MRKLNSLHFKAISFHEQWVAFGGFIFKPFECFDELKLLLKN